MAKSFSKSKICSDLSQELREKKLRTSKVLSFFRFISLLLRENIQNFSSFIVHEDTMEKSFRNQRFRICYISTDHSWVSISFMGNSGSESGSDRVFQGNEWQPSLGLVRPRTRSVDIFSHHAVFTCTWELIFQKPALIRLVLKLVSPNGWSGFVPPRMVYESDWISDSLKSRRFCAWVVPPTACYAVSFGMSDSWPFRCITFVSAQDTHEVTDLSWNWA